MKKLVKLMMLIVAMLTIGTSFTLATNANDSIKILEKANEGDANAQMQYAILLHDVKKHAEAKEWFEASAEQGVSFSQYILALYYLNGLAVKKDYKTGIKWLGKAAERGNASAKKFFCTTYDFEYKAEIPEVKIVIFLHGTNRLLTCKNNNLVFEEGDFNDTNTWTIETKRDPATAHYMPILRSLQGKYITGEVRSQGPAGLGDITEAATITISNKVFNNNPFPIDQPVADSEITGEAYEGCVIDHDDRELGMEGNSLFWGTNGYKLDILFI